MNKDQIHGKANQVKGEVKDAYGRLVDDPDARVSGAADKVKGKVQETVGDVKSAANRAITDAADSADRHTSRP